MAKTDPDRWVFEEWVTLTGFTPFRSASREQMLQARALYAKVYVDGRWGVGISAARMVATTTMFFEVEFGEPHAGERTLRSLYEHPDYGHGRYDVIEFEYAEHWMAAFEIWGGDVEGGIRRMRQLLTLKPRTLAHHAVGATLSLVLDESGLAIPDPMPPTLLAFALEFLGMHQGMRKSVAACTGSRKELVALLHEAHGRRPKATKQA